MARFSILGASGFIGRYLCAYLEGAGHEVAAITRDEVPRKGGDLGHAIYCIGLTADFRARIVETMRAHVSVLTNILEEYKFESFLYLSSTRVYTGADTADEESPLVVRPTKIDDLYNLSKLAGESICLARGYRVARLSNVIGYGDNSENFVSTLLRACEKDGCVTIRTAEVSRKDYIDINDVTGLLEKITLYGRCSIYNVASGTATDNSKIAQLLRLRMRAKVQFVPNGPTVSFPPIMVKRISEEFGFVPMPFEVTFNNIVNQMRIARGAQ